MRRGYAPTASAADKIGRGKRFLFPGYYKNRFCFVVSHLDPCPNVLEFLI